MIATLFVSILASWVCALVIYLLDRRERRARAWVEAVQVCEGRSPIPGVIPSLDALFGPVRFAVAPPNPRRIVLPTVRPGVETAAFGALQMRNDVVCNLRGVPCLVTSTCRTSGCQLLEAS